MNDSIAFDTLKMAARLEAAGYSSQQARAQTEAMAEALSSQQLATKSDIGLLKNDIDLLKVATKADIDGLRVATRADMAEFKTDVVRWLLGVAIVQTSLLVALIKLLPPGVHA
jgi:hypothetical protein